MRFAASFTVATALAFAGGCRSRPAPLPMPTRVSQPSDPVDVRPERPARWVIDGGTVAAEPSLPHALARALTQAGYTTDQVQDYVLVDLNADGRHDAVVLLVSMAAAGGFESLALLSEGEEVVLRPLAEVVAANEASPWQPYTLAVLPVVDGPTLIGAAPRPGACDQGPLWSFARVTGALLEPVGRLAVEPFDCAAADAQIEFVRDDRGDVEAVELRHGDAQTRYVWDAALGSFAPP